MRSGCLKPPHGSAASAAGEALHVSHAAISRQIRQLEAWFGQQAVRARGRGVRLTKAGLDLAPSVSDGFGRDCRCRRGALRRATGSGRIAVGCMPSIASRWLVPMLAEFSKAYRDVSVQVLYAQAEQRLGDGEYDVLITLGEDSSGDVERRRLFSRASKPVCSPHYLARSGKLATPQAILKKADLLHDESRAFWADWSRPPASSRRASCAARCSRTSICSARRYRRARRRAVSRRRGAPGDRTRRPHRPVRADHPR